MKQSRSTSFLKSLVSTATGFGISLAAQDVILPRLLGHPVPFDANLAFAAVMTVLSVARGYVLERVFEQLGWRVRLPPFVVAVLDERRRQVEQEGWSVLHDDCEHLLGDLATAGAAYAKQARIHIEGSPSERSILATKPRMFAPNWWPWDLAWWKPMGFRRDLVKACALIIADGEKFDRSRKLGKAR